MSQFDIFPFTNFAQVLVTQITVHRSKSPFSVSYCLIFVTDIRLLNQSFLPLKAAAKPHLSNDLYKLTSIPTFTKTNQFRFQFYLSFIANLQMVTLNYKRIALYEGA